MPAHTGVLLPMEPVLSGAAAHVCCGSQDACHPPRGPLHLIRQLHHPVLTYFLLGTTNFFISAVVSLDHFLAICRPVLLWDPDGWSCLSPTWAGFLASWVSLCPLPLHPHDQPTTLWPQWYCSLLLWQLALPEALLWRPLPTGAAGFRAIHVSVTGLAGTDLSFLYLHPFHCSQGPHNCWVKESVLHLCFTPYSGDHLLQQFHFSWHPSARDSVHAVQQRGLDPELYHHAPPETVHLQSLQWEGEVSPERWPQVELTHGCETPWGSRVKGDIPTRVGKYMNFRSHRQYLVRFSDNEIVLHKYAMWRSAFAFLPWIFLMPPPSHKESWSIWPSFKLLVMTCFFWGA